MRESCWSRGLAEARNYKDAGLQEGGWLRHRANQIRQMLRGCDATDMSFDGCRVYVLFCFVWLATLGVPVVARGTAAGPFRRVVEAPFSVPSSPQGVCGDASEEVGEDIGMAASLTGGT
jgi:hypothetical protein